MFLHHFYPDRASDDVDEPETAFTARTARWEIETGEFWGNFPQAYSMPGQTNAAMQLSRRWDDVL
jgi:hypothetical protein